LLEKNDTNGANTHLTFTGPSFPSIKTEKMLFVKLLKYNSEYSVAAANEI